MPEQSLAGEPNRVTDSAVGGPPGPQTALPSRATPGLLVALLPLVIMAGLLGVGYGVYRIKPQVLLIAAAVVAGLVGRALGYRWQELQEGIVDSIRKAMPATLILLCVGLLIGAWIACGTIPMIMYHGLELISPRFFLVTACSVCTVTALATGTSWGTIGTVGVALVGIALAQGIPAGAAAGAIVAGAYMGDKMSPFSDIPNLAPIATGANLFDTIRHMVWSALPAWLCGLAIYLVVGLRYGDAPAGSGDIARITTTLHANFTFSWLLLVPLALVLAFAVAKQPVIPGMLLSVALAGALAVTLQGTPLTSFATALNSGFTAHTGDPTVDRLLSRGGVMSMMETLLIAITAFCFGGIMQRTGLLAVLLERVARVARRTWSLVATSVVAAVTTALVTGSSYLSVLVPGELLAPVYRRQGLAAKNLSRIVVESGGIIVPLVPWSMAGVYIAGTLGVPTLSYLPWAFMNYLSVGMLLLYGCTGLTMAPRMRDDETQIGS
jgi:NhaC family Na+:H+ antiporter